jgi:hypothetical protein
MRREQCIKNRLLTGMLLVVQLILASCNTLITATTKSEIAFHEVIPPDDNTVIIYVYRLKSLVGGAAKWGVRLDGEVVAMLNQDAYTVLYTTPGDHTVTIGDSTSGALTRGVLGFGLVGIAAGNAADKAEMSSAEKKGALPKDQANDSFSNLPNRVYFFRSKGFGVAYVSREEAMKEIIHMKYEPNLNQE